MKLLTKRIIILWAAVLLAASFAVSSKAAQVSEEEYGQLAGESLRSRDRREKRKGIRDTEKRFEEAIKAGRITIGMKKKQVIEILGYPDDINLTNTSGGVHEQWCYGSVSEGTDMYVYFDNGIVMGWQH